MGSIQNNGTTTLENPHVAMSKNDEAPQIHQRQTYQLFSNHVILKFLFVWLIYFCDSSYVTLNIFTERKNQHPHSLHAASRDQMESHVHSGKLT